LSPMFLSWKMIKLNIQAMIKDFLKTNIW
jgi:hypothetical protein